MWKKASYNLSRRALGVAYLCFLFMLSLIGCAASDDAKAQSDRACSAVINVTGANRYKAVRLVPEIYNAADSNLSDLLVKDGNGEVVPYFINSGAQRADANKESYPMALINSYDKDNSFYFDYKLASARGSDTIATSIEFTTHSDNFAKEVDVYGSYDDKNWAFVQNDKIYSIDGKSKLAIRFADTQKYTHYRLKLANNLERISFDSAAIVYNVETSEETYFIESLTPVFSVAHGDRKTDISIDGLKNLRLCDITIDTDSMFKRTVSVPWRGYKELYSLSLNGMSYADTTLPLNWLISSTDACIITIDDGDDKPINVKGITVRYYADEVVFEGKAGEAYVLEFGGDSVKTAPVYDIERYKYDILKGEIDEAALGKITVAASEPQGAKWDYKLVFNIIITAVAILLGTIIVMKLKKKDSTMKGGL